MVREHLATLVRMAGSPEFRIDDVGVLRVLAHPLRLAILERLSEPATISQVAARLGTTRTRLYRHLHALHEIGAVEVVESRQARGFTESVYQAAARRFVPGPGLLSASSPGEVVDAVLATIFDTTRSDLSVRLASGELSLDQSGAGPRTFSLALELSLDQSGAGPRTFSLARQTVRMNPEQAAAVVRAVEQLVATMPDDAHDPDGRTYTFQYVFYPAGDTFG